MKRKLILPVRIIAFIMISTLLYGCDTVGTQKNMVDNETENEQQYVNLKSIPKDYSLEDAKRDGCVVSENWDLTSGSDKWTDFMVKSSDGIISRVRLANYYTLDEGNYSPEYYEEIKDEYPVMYILDLLYDGEKYILIETENGEIKTTEYNYLIQCEDVPENEDALYESCTRYILADDKTVTWDDIFKSQISSQMEVGEKIKYRNVLSIYKMKE